MAQEAVSRSALIADIQKLNERNPGNISRNYYRAHGAFSEGAWGAHFPKFQDFLAAAGIENAKPEPETSEISGDTWNITLPKTSICTLEQLLEYSKVDLSTWEVDRFVVNKWDSVVGEPLFQVKATLKKRVEIVAVRKEIELLKEAAKKEARIPRAIARKAKQSGNMLEVNIPDIHVGKLAWPKETSGRPYDTLIAPKMYHRALNTLLERTKGYDFEEVLFVVGNDLFNSDDLEGRTTKGTQV